MLACIRSTLLLRLMPQAEGCSIKFALCVNLARCRALVQDEPPSRSPPDSRCPARRLAEHSRPGQSLPHRPEKICTNAKHKTELTSHCTRHIAAGSSALDVRFFLIADDVELPVGVPLDLRAHLLASLFDVLLCLASMKARIMPLWFGRIEDSEWSTVGRSQKRLPL